MPTRLFMPSSGVPDISPAFDSEWDITTGVDRVALVRTRISSAMADKTHTKAAGNAANQDAIWRQYVSGPLAAQTIDGTVKGQLRARESSSSYNARMQVVIRVVSNDGLTERGTLYGGDLTTGTTNPTSELSASGTANVGTNRQMPRGASHSLSSFAIQDQDRLVIEVGYRIHTTSTTIFSATGIFGDNNATDLPEDQTTTTGDNPWIEFSGDIAEYVDPNAPQPRVVLYDTFTDTNGTLLENHVGETGATWTKHPASEAGSGIVVTDANRVRTNAAKIAIYTPSGVPETTDQVIAANLRIVSTESASVELSGRRDVSGSTFYEARFLHAPINVGSDIVQLAKIVMGTKTQIGQEVITSLASGTLPLFRLELLGATKKVYFNGVEAISSTDNAITATGLFGLGVNRLSAEALGVSITGSNTTGVHISDITGEDFAAVGVTLDTGGTATGVSTATTTSAATYATTVVTSGVSTVSAASELAVALTATALATGVSTVNAATESSYRAELETSGQATGTSDSSASTRMAADATGAVTGLSSAAVDATATMVTTGTATGVSSATAAPAVTVDTTAEASGLSEAGTDTTLAVTTTGTATGVSTVSAIALQQQGTETGGLATGRSTVSAQTAIIVPTAAVASGDATVTATSAATLDTSAEATGASTATATTVLEERQTLDTSAIVTGTSGVSATTTVMLDTTGAATGVSTAEAASATGIVLDTFATATGTSDVAASSQIIAWATGDVAGVSEATMTAVLLAVSGGVATGDSTVSALSAVGDGLIVPDVWFVLPDRPATFAISAHPADFTIPHRPAVFTIEDEP